MKEKYSKRSVGPKANILPVQNQRAQAHSCQRKLWLARKEFSLGLNRRGPQGWNLSHSKDTPGWSIQRGHKAYTKSPFKRASQRRQLEANWRSWIEGVRKREACPGSFKFKRRQVPMTFTTLQNTIHDFENTCLWMFKPLPSCSLHPFYIKKTLASSKGG